MGGGELEKRVCVWGAGCPLYRWEAADRANGAQDVAPQVTGDQVTSMSA